MFTWEYEMDLKWTSTGCPFGDEEWTWTWTWTKFRSESNNVYLYIRVVSIFPSVTWSIGYRARMPRRPWRDAKVCVVSSLEWE